MADGEDGFQIWRVSVNILHKQSREVAMDGISILEVQWGG
jgi:hypothetical protein